MPKLFQVRKQRSTARDDGADEARLVRSRPISKRNSASGTAVRKPLAETAAAFSSSTKETPVENGASERDDAVAPIDRRLLFKGSLGALGESVRRLSVSLQTSISSLQQSAMELMQHEEKTDDTSCDMSSSSSSLMDDDGLASEPKDDAAKIRWILEQLSPEELELAACTSYKYLTEHRPSKQSLTHSPTDGTPSSDRVRYATVMIRRYLASKKGDEYAALNKVRRTLQFREEYCVAGLMTAFDGSTATPSKQRTRDRLKQCLSSNKLRVQGYDRKGRATLVFTLRNSDGHDPEWSIKEAVYTMERAVACSARKQQEATQQQQHPTDPSQSCPTINAIVDCSGFSAWKHAPPMDVGKKFMLTLRDHYAGQVNRIFVLDAPSGFLWLWNLVQPFVGSGTKSKIVFVNGRRQRQQLLGKYYDVSPSSFVSSLGKKPSSDDRRGRLDVDEYLCRTPFDRTYGECHGLLYYNDPACRV